MHCIHECCQKGIKDHDVGGIRRNFGFIDNEAVVIDFGSFSKEEFLKDPATHYAEVLKKTRRLGIWLEKYAPDLLPCYEETLSHVSAPAGEQA